MSEFERMLIPILVVLGAVFELCLVSIANIGCDSDFQEMIKRQLRAKMHFLPRKSTT